MNTLTFGFFLLSAIAVQRVPSLPLKRSALFQFQMAVSREEAAPDSGGEI